MKPITRQEIFLAKLSGGDVVTPEPVTREEMFLDEAAGHITDMQEEVESLGSGFTVKGVVEDVDDLPETGELGDLYLVSGEGYESYVWNGTAYVLKGSDIATAQELLDALFS